MEMGEVEKKAQQREKRVAEQSISPSTFGKSQKGRKREERLLWFSSTIRVKSLPVWKGQGRRGKERQARRALPLDDDRTKQSDTKAFSLSFLLSRVSQKALLFILSSRVYNTKPIYETLSICA